MLYLLRPLTIADLSLLCERNDVLARGLAEKVHQNQMV